MRSCSTRTRSGSINTGPELRRRPAIPRFIGGVGDGTLTLEHAKAYNTEVEGWPTRSVLGGENTIGACPARIFRDGDILWKGTPQRATDWTRPADDIVIGITRKLVKKFHDRT